MRWIVINELPGQVDLAWFALRDVTVRQTSESLQAELRARAAELKGLYAGPPAAAPLFAPARNLYHRLGIDPSKHRPSCEALVRRILQGKELYTVNTAVDAANLASILHLRPVGLYDADRIEPWDQAGEAAAMVSPGEVAGVRLRLGMPGDEYPGIGKETIHLEGRPGLFDRRGPFGNPSSDSDRTKVTRETKRLLFVLFEPAGEAAGTIAEHLTLSRAILLRHVGGEVEDSRTGA